MTVGESLRDPKLLEFWRFCIVGVLCTAIDSIGFYATYGLIGYRIALIIGFTSSIIVNYFLNIKWSFKRKPS